MKYTLSFCRDEAGSIYSATPRIGFAWVSLPTVLVDIPKTARVMNEEPFGPVALMSRFKDFDEVMTEANRLPYGIASYAYTRSVKTSTALVAGIESGMLSINHHGLGLPELPFGGVEDSGYGSEGGLEAVEAYLATKFVSQGSLAP